MAQHRSRGRARRAWPVLVALAAVLAWSLPGVAASSPRDLSASCPGYDHPFTDVDGVHEQEVGCLFQLGVTVGVAERRYAPQRELTRGQLAALVARTLERAGVALPESDTSGWRDVDDGPLAEAIGRLTAAGVYGEPDGSFHPGARPSRAETATVLAAALRVAGVLATTGRNLFLDDDTLAAVTQQAIDDLAAAGVALGVDVGRYDPTAKLTRGQSAGFLARAHDLVATGGAPPTEPPPDPVVRSDEGWLVAGGASAVVGSSGTLTRYTVEVADGLEARHDVLALARRVEQALHDPDQGWTARGQHRLQRVDDPARARVRVVLATPGTVDRLCAQAGLDTGGFYSCWNGHVAALNSDRWEVGVAHVSDDELYRSYLVNHEVGHGLGHGHRPCPGQGRIAPVMMQLSKSTYGCVANPWPHP